jgi:hypothetical protein
VTSSVVLSIASIQESSGPQVVPMFTTCEVFIIVQDGNCSVAGKWNCMLGCLTHGGQLEIKIFLYSFVQFSWFQFCFLFLRVGLPLFDPC